MRDSLCGLCDDATQQNRLLVLPCWKQASLYRSCPWRTLSNSFSWKRQGCSCRYYIHYYLLLLLVKIASVSPRRYMSLTSVWFEWEAQLTTWYMNDGFCLEYKKKNNGSLRRLNIRDQSKYVWLRYFGSRSQNSQKKNLLENQKELLDKLFEV